MFHFDAADPSKICGFSHKDHRGLFVAMENGRVHDMMAMLMMHNYLYPWCRLQPKDGVKFNMSDISVRLPVADTFNKFRVYYDDHQLQSVDDYN